MKVAVRARRYKQKEKATGERADGIAIVRRDEGRVIALLNAQQARAFADRLHDLADDLETASLGGLEVRN